MRRFLHIYAMNIWINLTANGCVVDLNITFKPAVDLFFQGLNLKCFITRVASHPERLQYIYFNTILLLRAVARLGPYLSAFDYCSTGKHEDDVGTLHTLSKVINIAQNIGKFDETILFRGENANASFYFHAYFAANKIYRRIGLERRVQGAF